MRLPLTMAAVLSSLVLLTACATAPHSQTVTPPAPVLLISIDGLHPDYLGKGITPNLDRIASEGVRAQWMTPSFPSLTFPNHYTLVTGLRPDHHGIVHNAMRDEELGSFRVGDEASNIPPQWWNAAEPIWVTAEKQGIKTANWAWPGSVSKIQGIQPSLLHLYDPKVPVETRADTVANWILQAPTPRFTAMYFELVDTAAHHYGPHSRQASEAVQQVDSAIGRLIGLLEKSGKLEQTNLIIVSDHGMAEVAPQNVLAVEDMVNPDWVRLHSVGQTVGFQPLPGHEVAAEAQLLGQHEHYQCWRKDQLPAHWHYGSNPRIPSITCLMQAGWDALPRKALEARQSITHPRGSHGYEPTLPAMRATFLARGPAFKQGAIIPAIDNVDVYPLLSRLIGIAPRPNDGDANALLPALKQP